MRHDGPEEKAVAEKIGGNVARLRTEAGTSIAEIARRAELDRSYIPLIEKGERLPRLDTVLRLAGALGAEPDELLQGVVWRSRTYSGGEFCIDEGDTAADAP